MESFNFTPADISMISRMRVEFLTEYWENKPFRQKIIC